MSIAYDGRDESRPRPHLERRDRRRRSPDPRVRRPRLGHDAQRRGGGRRQGPSLYKRLPDRAALLRAVADSVVDDLSQDDVPATETDDPRADLRAAAVAYRAFVRRNPNGYRLLFTELPSGANPDASSLAALGEPSCERWPDSPGGRDALEAARTFVAWAHGFASMELAGAFRLGGDLDAAYAFGIESILAGVSAPATRASG